jgi:hypothetical protein
LKAYSARKKPKVQNKSGKGDQRESNTRTGDASLLSHFSLRSLNNEANIIGEDSNPVTQPAGAPAYLS